MDMQIFFFLETSLSRALRTAYVESGLAAHEPEGFLALLCTLWRTVARPG